jgi:phosphohistidine phosphatase
MKHLFLLRHAKSSWDDPTLADHDRPLARRGRRAAKVMAKHLGRKGIAPELVLCSPTSSVGDRKRRTARRSQGCRMPAPCRVRRSRSSPSSSATGRRRLPVRPGGHLLVLHRGPQADRRSRCGGGGEARRGGGPLSGGRRDHTDRGADRLANRELSGLPGKRENRHLRRFSRVGATGWNQ